MSVLLKQIEVLWKLICESNFLRLIQLSYLQGGSEIDSVVRSRQILTLLGIPFSKLGASTTNSTDHVMEGKSQAQDKPPQNGKNKKEALSYDHMTPERIQKLLPWTRCCQVKDLIVGWIKQRSISKNNTLEGGVFLFKTLDTSLLELGESGLSLITSSRRKFLFEMRGKSAMLFYDYIEVLRNALTNDSPTYSADIQSKLYDMLKFEIQPPRTTKTTYSPVSREAIDAFVSAVKWESRLLYSTILFSYLICDFARLLVVSRVLVSLTTVPSADKETNSKLHPLDVLDNQIIANKEKKRRVFLLLDEFEEKILEQSSLPLSVVGLNARLRVCDTISYEDLYHFFEFGSDVSERFNNYRGLICDGLVSLFADLKATEMNSLMRSLVQQLRQSSGTSNALAYIRSQTYDFNKETVNNSMTTKPTNSSHQEVSSNELAGIKSGVSDMLKLLQNFRISEFLNNTESQSQKSITFASLKRYSLRFSQYYKSNGGSLGSHFVVSTEETNKVDQIFNNTGTLLSSSGVNKSLRVDSPDQMVPDKLALYRVAAKEGIMNGLIGAYSVLNILYELLAAVLYLIGDSSQSYASVYNYDVSNFIARSNNYNPFCALSLSFLNSERNVYPISHLPTIQRRRKEQTNIQSAMRLSCCDSLLSLSMNPCKADSIGRIPLVIAAITGQFQLLEKMIRACKDSQLRRMSIYSTLLWHVLMQSPLVLSNKPCDLTWVNFETCALTLLQYNFPTDVPSISMDDANMSCLDLAVWKGIESVAYRLVCTRDVRSTSQQDSKLFPDDSLAQRLLFEHEASHLEKYNKGANNYSNQKVPSTGLSAVHICNLWSNFQLSTLNSIYHHSAVRSLSGLIEKQSIVLYQFIVDCERYMSIHSEVMSLQLQEPEDQPGSEEKELKFIRWIKDLGVKSHAAKQNDARPKLSGLESHKTLVSLNCYTIFAECFRSLFKVVNFQEKMRLSLWWRNWRKILPF